jgi:hypothetical protein
MSFVRTLSLSMIVLGMAGGAQGELPKMTVTELADLVQSYQNRIRQVRTKYLLVYGTVREGGVADGPFVPQSPEWSVSAEWGQDYSKDSQYLREDLLLQGKHHITECAFDGKTGTRLVSHESESYALSGRIVQGPPEELRVGESHYPCPSEMTYWLAMGHDIPTLLRKGKNVEIREEVMEGLVCYRVTVLTETPRVITYQGKQVTGIGQDLRRLWVAPERNMLPVRIEDLGSRHPGDMEGKLRVVQRQFDLREIEPGVWFPFKSRRWWTVPSGDPTVSELTIESVALNEKADVPARVTFPQGTGMTDEIAHLKYRVGMSAERADELVRRTVEMVRAAQKGSVSLPLPSTPGTQPSTPVGPPGARKNVTDPGSSSMPTRRPLVQGIIGGIALLCLFGAGCAAWLLLRSPRRRSSV